MLTEQNRRMVLAVNTGVETLRKESTYLHTEVETLREEESRQKIYSWLLAPDHQSKHANARRERQQSTGSWFVKGRHFEEWRCRANSFLWLHGIRKCFPALLSQSLPLMSSTAGAGKTVLWYTPLYSLSSDDANTIILQALRSLKRSPDIASQIHRSRLHIFTLTSIVQKRGQMSHFDRW
jgi:hypothetical protein